MTSLLRDPRAPRTMLQDHHLLNANVTNFINNVNNNSNDGQKLEKKLKGNFVKLDCDFNNNYYHYYHNHKLLNRCNNLDPVHVIVPFANKCENYSGELNLKIG